MIAEMRLMIDGTVWTAPDSVVITLLALYAEAPHEPDHTVFIERPTQRERLVEWLSARGSEGADWELFGRFRIGPEGLERLGISVWMRDRWLFDAYRKVWGEERAPKGAVIN